ncbi:MAG: type II toxin-antitoxin system VapC family toxin [Solirubrobacteraceae bacterium]|nr:type II toxin-antitoxin system VapC family toxin [Solirubrobacteraceae bacterium]
MDAFDADVLIYAAVPGHELGTRVLAQLPEPGSADDPPSAIGSVLLLPELLSKPIRQRADDEVAALVGILARIRLLPTDEATAMLAASLGAEYGLKAADATHLATAVQAGADRFVTNNARDFDKAIEEIEIVRPDALAG